MFTHIAVKRFCQRAALPGHAAADEQHLRPEQVGHVGGQFAQIGFVPLQHGSSRFIAPVPRLIHVPGVKVRLVEQALRAERRSFLGLPNQRGGGNIALHTPLAATSAPHAIDDEGRVPHLCTGATCAFHQFPIDDDAASHTGSQRQQHHIPASACRTGNRFPQCRAVGVIADAARQPGQPGDLRGKRHIFPAQVVGIDHRTGVARAWAANAHAHAIPFRQAACIAQTHGQRSHVRDDLLPGARRPRRNALLPENPV